MEKVFVKKGELKLVNGGYLSDKEGNPINNAEFVSAQKQAEYIIAFAKAAKGKDFVGKKAYSVAALRYEVLEASNKKEEIKYVKSPKAVKQTTTNTLAKEAMDFMKFEKNTSKVAKINKFLANFNTIHEFEEFGLFFDQDIVKLTEIYTMEDIVTAVESVIDLLD